MISSLASRAPVWSQSRSEADLLELYAEEITLVEALEQDDADAKHVSVAFRNDAALPGAHASAVPEPTTDEQQVCRIYPAQASTLLFDISADNPHDSVSHMLGSDFNDNHMAQEIACEDTPARPDRSLTYPPSVCDGAVRNVLHDEEQPLLGNEAEVDRVLSLIPSNAFLPGIDHLSNVEVRSTFVSFDAELHNLQQATTRFGDDHLSREHVAFDDKFGVELPGKNFLLAENTTDVVLSIQHPTAESLLTMLDELVDGDTLVENVADTMPQLNQHLLYTANAHHSCNKDAPPQGAIFNTGSYQYTAYTALNQLMDHTNNMSRPILAQPHNVSDISDEEVDELSTTQLPNFDICLKTSDELFLSVPTELTYFDAYAQQPVAYTAFNQLLVDLDNDETLSHIHREDDPFDEDDSVVDGVLELGELYVDNSTTELASSLPDINDLSGFDFDFDRNLGMSSTQPTSHTANVASRRTVESLRSYSFSQRRKSRKRAFLRIDTKLADVVEAASDEEAAPSSASSDSSIEFTGQRGFAQQLSIRRSDFLSDEDSDEDVEQSQSAPAPLSSDAPVFTSALISRVAEITCELFSDHIWHTEPVLALTIPPTPAQPYPGSPTSLTSLDPASLDAVEAEILGLIARTFEFISQGKLADLQALGSDLQWASNAITEVCPRLGLITQLSTVVEILLERIVVLSGDQ